jgi:Ca-activated chloride channel family protein
MKISRAIVLSTLLAGSAHASSWSDLWYRRDQQGQQSLQAGDSKRAAELFQDPRRQAYAELQSGEYAAAAQRLEPFADADSQYNRGNALAKSGDLQGALKAYDGALKHAELESALRRDAEHNRDLVARQLQAQTDQQHSSSGQQPPPPSKESGKPQGNESKDGSGDSGDKKPDGSKQSGTQPKTPASPSSPAQAKAGDEQRQADGTPQPTKDQHASSPEASKQHSAEQQANEGRQEPSPGSGSRSGTEQSDARKAALGDSVLPQTEQQLALEQWLRQIPDDPGGLLRRKFMIEHLIKQQQVQP